MAGLAFFLHHPTVFDFLIPELGIFTGGVHGSTGLVSLNPWLRGQLSCHPMLPPPSQWCGDKWSNRFRTVSVCLSPGFPKMGVP